MNQIEARVSQLPLFSRDPCFWWPVSSPHLDKSGCSGEQLYCLLPWQDEQASVVQLRVHGMILPHWLLYSPWRRKGAALSRNAAEGVACSLFCLFSLTRSIEWWQGRQEESNEERAVAGKGRFTAAAPTPPISSSSSTLNLGLQQFLSVLRLEKTHHRWQWTCLINQKSFRHIHSEHTCVVLGGMVLWASCVSGVCI